MAARAFGLRPELSTGVKLARGKTLDWDAGCSTRVLGFAVHTAALAAQLLQPQRGNLSGAFSYLAGFLGELSARSQRFAAICGGRRRRRSPSITAPTGRRPLHRGGRATHPRAPIGFILHALECRCFATAQARSQRRPARVLRLPPYVASHRGGRAGQPRAPTRAHASFARTSAMARTRATRHACCRSRGRRGPVGCPGSRVAARVA